MKFHRGKKGRIIRRRDIVTRLSQIAHIMGSMIEVGHGDYAPLLAEHTALTYELTELAAFDDAGWQKEK